MKFAVTPLVLTPFVPFRNIYFTELAERVEYGQYAEGGPRASHPGSKSVATFEPSCAFAAALRSKVKTPKLYMPKLISALEKKKTPLHKLRLCSLYLRGWRMGGLKMRVAPKHSPETRKEIVILRYETARNPVPEAFPETG